jgi:DNA-binding ferritin-like protein
LPNSSGTSRHGAPGDQIFATTDAIAERVRKIGKTTLRSVRQISRLQRPR